ncbi:MAG TPA: DUF2252 domain-containing protein [Candidatus Limnocylindrales bacterium]|nr:DUF2252 domain-containing protein [Candidatus Limnocylindrales bacterium]
MTDGASVADRLKAGETARAKAPWSATAAWKPAADRPDPIALLVEQAATRLPDLVPVRYGRMSTSPFAYYRGAALPMAADLATLAVSGIRTQLCGDAHLSNFGMFASPERDLVFDITDFDETLEGPWEWDLLRLAASIVIAGRTRGFATHATHHAVVAAAHSYQQRMAGYAQMRAIDVFYSKVDAAAILDFVDVRARKYLATTIKAAAHHDAIHELPKITTVEGGRVRIVDRPPTISHPPEVTDALTAATLQDYRGSLQEDRRALFDRYRLVDTALKVVGIGSVGLAAFVALFEGVGADDPLFLQVKEAEASVLERFLEPSPMPTHGERIVTGQRRLQATSDVLLGWAVGPRGRHLYARQHQDQKGAAVVEVMTVDDLTTWGELCAWALARGHARSGDPAEIAGSIGDAGEFGHAVGAVAATYADANERDFAAFTQAIKDGRLPAQTGV